MKGTSFPSFVKEKYKSFLSLGQNRVNETTHLIKYSGVVDQDFKEVDGYMGTVFIIRVERLLSERMGDIIVG